MTDLEQRVLSAAERRDAVAFLEAAAELGSLQRAQELAAYNESRRQTGVRARHLAVDRRPA